MKNIIISLLSLALVVSCSEDSVNNKSGRVAVNFSGLPTRVANGAWESGDQIGIYMVEGGAQSLAPIVDGAANIVYSVDAAGVTTSFSAVDKVLYYPATNELVDFYAYSPYRATLTDGEYSIDVSQQSPRSAIDVITSRAKGKNLDDTQVSLDFDHQLSMLTLNIEPGDGIPSLDGMVTTITGHNTRATLSIYDNGVSGANTVADIEAITSIAEDGTTATSTLLLIPSERREGAQILFEIAGEIYEWDISAIEFEQNQNLVYNVTIEKLRVVVEPTNIQPWGEGEQVTETAK